jgi:ATP-dependent Clp protease ATP-binding subunit ClpA
MNPVLRGWLPRFVILSGVLALLRYSNALSWLLVIVAWLVLIGLIVVDRLNLHRYLPRFISGSIKPVAAPRTKADDAPKSVANPEDLASALKARVFGHDEVIEELARTLRRRLIAKRADRPVAIFCFLGPRGCGKAYLARTLVETLFADMRHFQIVDAANSPAAVLFGSHGAETYGKLTSALRAVPDSIILIEEFGKVGAEIQKRFLSAWNNGYITEASDGAAVATNEAIFILTFDVAAPQLEGLAHDAADAADVLTRAARAALVGPEISAEVLGRIDETFVFHELQGLDVARVLAVEIENIAGQYGLQVAASGIDPAIFLDAIDKVADAAGDHRAVSRRIERQIADGLLNAKAAGATHVRLTSEDGKIRVSSAAGADRSSPEPAGVPA